jgi:hypothetical protein
VLASFDAAVASAAGSSTDAPAVRASGTTVSDRNSAAPATGIDCVDEMALALGNKGGSSEVLSGKYFTAAGGIKWARVPGLDSLVAEAYNAVAVAHSKHGGKSAAREAVVKVLHGHTSLSADLKEALTVERVVPWHQHPVEKILPRLKAMYLTQTGAGDISSPYLCIYNALEDYKEKRDKEKDVSTAEQNKQAEKKETLTPARLIATGKISRVANSIAGAVELPESPEVARDVFPDSEKVDDSLLDLVSDDMEVDDGGGGESWHSSGDDDDDAGTCERDGAAGASAPTISRSRFLNRARGADAMRATKAPKKKRTTAREMVAKFQDKAAKSLAAADDG